MERELGPRILVFVDTSGGVRGYVLGEDWRQNREMAELLAEIIRDRNWDYYKAQISTGAVPIFLRDIDISTIH